MTDEQAVKAFNDGVAVIHNSHEGSMIYERISALITRHDPKTGQDVLSVELYKTHEICIAIPAHVFRID